MTVAVSKYINMIAPEHQRTSCSDEYLYNAAYSATDFDGYGRCHRCTLIAAMLSDDADNEHNKE